MLKWSVPFLELLPVGLSLLLLAMMTTPLMAQDEWKYDDDDCDGYEEFQDNYSCFGLPRNQQRLEIDGYQIQQRSIRETNYITISSNQGLGSLTISAENLKKIVTNLNLLPTKVITVRELPTPVPSVGKGDEPVRRSYSCRDPEPTVGQDCANDSIERIEQKPSTEQHRDPCDGSYNKRDNNSCRGSGGNNNSGSDCERYSKPHQGSTSSAAPSGYSSPEGGDPNRRPSRGCDGPSQPR
jgi:hypothetical protein